MNRKMLALLASILLAVLSVAFADLRADASFENQKIVASAIVTDAGSATGAATYTYAFKTVEKIKVTNTGIYDEKAVLLTQELPAVPEKTAPLAKIQANGKKAVWSLGDMEPGMSIEVSVSFPMLIEPGQLASFPAASVSSAPPRAVLEADSDVAAGATVSLKLLREDGTPIGAKEVVVFSPNGKKMVLETNQYGEAQFTAEDAGAYYYSIEGVHLLAFASTNAQGNAEPPAAGSMTNSSNDDFLKDLASFLPVLGGIAVLSLFMLGAIFFFSRKGANGALPEMKAAEPKPQLKPEEKEKAGDGPIPARLFGSREVEYDSAETERIRTAREITRQIIEMRKAEMAKQAEAEREAIKRTEEEATRRLGEQYERRPAKKPELKKPEMKKAPYAPAKRK